MDQQCKVLQLLPKGSSTGTQTKADGTYQLSVSSSTTVLVFSFVGYDQQEVSIKGSSVDIKLVNTNTTLGEVVVTGYGTARKKDLTGSIATVTSREFIKGSITTPEQLIAGKVPGVSIISNGGQPGSGSTIRIRGGSSLSASNDPLIVIDGVPLDNGGIAGGNNPL
jgi:iron complex outermembrane receptor protein